MSLHRAGVYPFYFLSHIYYATKIVKPATTLPCVCYCIDMPSRSSKPKDHDFTTVALRVVEQAIGEKWNGSPLPDKDAGKNPAAVALGRLGGAKGGRARADKLTPAKRSQIAKKAAKARWKQNQTTP